MDRILTDFQTRQNDRNEAIRKLYKEGWNMAQISRKYKLSRQRIHQIIKTVDKYLTR